jgi:hypothetical protein
MMTKEMAQARVHAVRRRRAERGSIPTALGPVLEGCDGNRVTFRRKPGYLTRWLEATGSDFSDGNKAPDLHMSRTEIPMT